jgi:hypothetical protein
MTTKLFPALEELDCNSVNYSLEEIEELQDSAIERADLMVAEAKEAMEEIDEGLRYAERLFALGEKMRRTKKVALEDMIELGFASESLTDKYGVAVESFIANVDANMSLSTALEEVEGKAVSIFTRLKNTIKDIGNSFIDNFGYIIKATLAVNKSQRALEDALRAAPDRAVDLTFNNISRYMCIGKGRPVKGLDEYLREFKRLSEAMVSLNEITADIARDDFLSYFKMIGTFVTRSAEDVAAMHNDKMETIKDKLVKAADLKEHKHGLISYYLQDTMLGGSRARVVLFKRKSSSLVSLLNTTLEFHVAPGFNQETDSSVTFKNTKKKDMENLLSYCDDLNKSTEYHRTLMGIWGQFTSMMQVSSIFTAGPAGFIGAGLFSIISRSYRMYILGVFRTVTTSGNALGFSLRNKKQAHKVVNKYLKAVA